MTYTQPLFVFFAAVALTGVLLKRRSLAIGGVLALFVITYPAAEWLFSRPLEARYPVRPFDPPPEIQAIVVFSGGVAPPVFERPYAFPNRDTYERCRYAAWIYQKRPLPILACGGSSPLEPGGPSFSAAMADLLRRDGVPDTMIWTEDKSTDTHQNARYGAEILRRHGVQRVALVVDARSMVRADWKGLRGNEDTLHECLGLLWYRLRGWI